MAKRERIIKSKDAKAKKYGRSYGPLVLDEKLNDMVTVKVLKARKTNNPARYR